MIIKLKVQDGQGQALEGLPVTLTGCGAAPTITGANGMVQFLPDSDIPTTTVSISGTVAWTGPTAELRSNEVFEKTGSGFARK